MIELAFTKPQLRRILKALDGPSCTDPELAAIYEAMKQALEESAPTAPWRKVVDAYGSGAYRGDGTATNLKLECGHYVRMVGATDHEIKRQLNAGVPMRRRCHECDGRSSRHVRP